MGEGGERNIGKRGGWKEKGKEGMIDQRGKGRERPEEEWEIDQKRIVLEYCKGI